MPKKKPVNPTSKQATTSAIVRARRKVKQPKYKSFRVSKRIRTPKAPISGSFKLFAISIKTLLRNWRLFGGIVMVYLLLTVVLVKGFGVSSNIAQLKDTAQSLFQGSTAGLLTGLTLFSVLLGNANSTASEVAGAYQSMLLIIISLVLIWSLRQTLAKQKVQVRDAFYKSLAPFIPFFLVLMVIGLQLIPMLVANYLYVIIFGNGVAVTLPEKGICITLITLLIVLSLYMISSSIFALYIVTLPGMRPMKAIRSARDLVRHRRSIIVRKLLFLPVAMLVLAAIITVPFIIISPSTAEALFFLLNMMALAVGHSYMYHLYRELL